MRFTKMHGAGNDYVYVSGFEQPIEGDLGQLARRMSHRRFGVGADGMILILPSEVADAQMRMFNVDGSEGQMCGNGLRCVAKYVWDHILRRDELSIETAAGVLKAWPEVHAGQVDSVRIDVGQPRLDAADIPTTLTEGQCLDVLFEVDGRLLDATCVSFGNPHCVVFVDEADDDLVLGLGPQIERHPHFPQRTNVEFAQVLSRGEARQRTWERGSGETWACGTGASAVCVAGVLTDRMDRRATIHLLGGDLQTEWSEADNHVYLTGPAATVFSGVWPANQP